MEAISIPENPIYTFMKDITKDSGGKITFDFHNVGEICSTSDMPDLVSKGSIAMASYAPSYFPTLAPLNALLQYYHPLQQNVQTSQYTWRHLIDQFPYLQDEWHKVNQHALTLIRE